ncbi:MAG: hypothetical protein OCD76_02620 [Reichenbachiella sp.]
MLRGLVWLGIVMSLFACQNKAVEESLLVNNNKELVAAVKEAKAGDIITLANGVWEDVQLKLRANGTKSQPITLQAEEAGKVIIQGESYIKLGSDYWVVEGLHFKNGFSPSSAIIEFKIDDQVANNCRVTNCVITDFNKMQRDKSDRWVQFWGRYNQLDHCYIAGKTNRGPTVRVDLRGNENIKNYHQIVNNHFGPREAKGGPSGETIQIGNSFTSMSPSNTMVANNLFEKCNGEVEVISSKTNFNEFRNNVFYKCEGSLVTRHGNYCIIDGNYFIGDENNTNIGGIRIINTGHWVTNNYFYNLKGSSFRSPLAVMNGIPKSPLNRYNQVTDVVVAYNTWVNCPSPWQFGVGTNISQKDVLPLSEIRSARPERMLVANNILYNETGDAAPIVEHDKADGVTFKNNVINNEGVDFGNREGLVAEKIKMNKLSDQILVPAQSSSIMPFDGFEFESITNDLFGNPRSTNNAIGAVGGGLIADPKLMDKSKYGASWYSNEEGNSKGNTIEASAEAGDLVAKVALANNGDVIVLTEGVHVLKEQLAIIKNITIRSKGETKAEIVYNGTAGTPAFLLSPKGNLTISNLVLKGNGANYAFATLQKGMFDHYRLTVDGLDISGFAYVLKAYKESFAEEISFTNTKLSNCANGIELSGEIKDKGDYNVEFLTIDNCQFDQVVSNVIDYYRGGYDESTIGGNLVVTNCTFTNSGAGEESKILIKSTGIVNVNIENNNFTNNSVKLVALLWGAKNNVETNNKIKNSGKILTQENIELKLMY